MSFGEGSKSAGQEIERKFLIRSEGVPTYLQTLPHELILQGYVAVDQEGSEVRVRRKGNRYSLTVKSRGGLARREVEIPLSREQFEALWPLTGGRVVEKIRYWLEEGGTAIELDVYRGRLAGLVTAEVEFSSLAESQRFVPPSWFGAEVTEDPRYRNESLALGKTEVPRT